MVVRCNIHLIVLCLFLFFRFYSAIQVMAIMIQYTQNNFSQVQLFVRVCEGFVNA